MPLVIAFAVVIALWAVVLPLLLRWRGQRAGMRTATMRCQRGHTSTSSAWCGSGTLRDPRLGAHLGYCRPGHHWALLVPTAPQPPAGEDADQPHAHAG